MKWFIALNEQGVGFDAYAAMAKVAVLSALAHTELEPHLVFDGAPCELTAWMEAHGVRVIHARTRLYDDVRAVAEERNDPLILSIGAGSFLRTDLPTLLPELGIHDKYILYTDCDVLVLRDVTPELRATKPFYFAVAPEFDQKNYRRMNSGVMVMNLPNLRRNDRAFIEFTRRNMQEFTRSAYDQNAFRLFYRFPVVPFVKWQRLPLVLNWKPYWGVDPNAGIIHFHGPKPAERAAFARGEGYEPHRKHIAPAYFHYSEIWESYLPETAPVASAAAPAR